MNTLVKRFFEPEEESFFLFGPRGTGKSTLLQTIYPSALTIDLLDPLQLRQYQTHPEYLFDTVRAAKQKTIVIDEIQKVPELLSVVHSLLEQKLGLQFILTGSSSRKLKRAGVDLLAGRAVVRHLHPFMAAELSSHFTLENALNNGLVPLIIESKNITAALNAYIGLYLKEEVQAEGLVRNIGHFSRFLEAASFSHGSILNMSNIARECQVSRKLIEGYVDILEDLLLGYRLPIFTKRAKRNLVSHPKLYFFDAGVYKSLRNVGYLDCETEINGPGLEGLVLQHLNAWNDYRDGLNKLYYWRTRSGVEVDFVLYGKEVFYAIEVKNSATLHPADLRGLSAFCKDYPEATPILLYRGKDRIKKQDILCLPVSEFLLQVTPQNNTLPT